MPAPRLGPDRLAQVVRLVAGRPDQIHGAGRASQHYRRQAAALADAYTAFIPDRRGRGLSGPPGAGYSLPKAAEDVSAVMDATGAQLVFGHSGGGVIALELALTRQVQALVLYVPAVPIHGSLPSAWLPPFEQALAQGRAARAMAIFIKVLHLNELADLPGWLLTALFGLSLRGPGRAEAVELLHTLAPEIRLLLRLDSAPERYRAIPAPALLLAGSRSPAFLRDVLPALASSMPHATAVELPGLNQGSPEEAAPPIIAARVRQFLR